MFREAFISHAHIDNTVCAVYKDALEASGIRVWMDLTDSQIGHSLSDDIVNQLKKKSALLVMVTGASLNSRWVDFEINNFLGLLNAKDTYLVDGQERIIIPIRLESVAFPPSKLIGFTGIDAVGRPIAQVVAEIVAALRIIKPMSSLPTSLSFHHQISSSPTKGNPKRLSLRILRALSNWMDTQWRTGHRFLFMCVFLLLIATGIFWVWFVPIYLVLENIALLFWLRLPKQTPAKTSRLVSVRVLMQGLRAMQDSWDKGHKIWIILLFLTLSFLGAYVIIPIVIALDAFFYPIKVAVQTRSWPWLFSYLTLVLVVIGIIAGIAISASANSSSQSSYY